MKVLKKWEYSHGAPVECMCQADDAGEVVLGDLLGNIAYLNADGTLRWKKKVDYTPHSIVLSEDGAVIYVLTKNHYLIRMDREGKEEWDLWIMKNTFTLACMAKGQAAAVGGIQGSIQIINSRGKRAKLLHTREPATYVRFASRVGGLFVASAMGWVGIFDKHWKLRKEYHLRRHVAKLEVTCLGRKIFLPAREGGLVAIEVDKDDLLTYSTNFEVSSAAVDRKGERIIMVGAEGSATLLDSAGGELWRRRFDHSWLFSDMTIRGDKFVLVSDKGFVICNAILSVREAEKRLADSYFEFLEL
ncbi:MAG: hypothetical protein OEZ32_04350 [Nitrospinota bacterium]|nr:hypothetical protein [Nitrospinota bacterium]